MKRLEAGPMPDDYILIIVVFQGGSTALSDIARSLTDIGRLVFAIPESDYTAQPFDTPGQAGTVVRLTGETEADAARLAEHHPDGIVTYSEQALRQTAALARALGLPFHTPEVTQLLTDKLRQRQVLTESGVDKIAFAQVDSPAQWDEAVDRIGLPLIIKPVRGSGSRGVRILKDAVDAARLKDELFDADTAGEPKHLLAEEFLRGRPSESYGDYISVESFSGPQGVTHVAATGKFPLRPPFAEQGSFWPSHLCGQELTAVYDLVSGALDALGVEIGITHTEVQLTAAGPRIIEVNGRLGGQIHDLSQHSGAVDLIRANGLVALGLPVDVRPVQLDRVHFLHLCLAPLEPATYVAVRGLRQVRRMPGIVGFTNLVSPGTSLPGTLAGQRIAKLYGEVSSHAEMAELLEDVLPMLVFDYEYVG